MADAIGNVRATFTASATGMTGAIDQIVGKLGGFAAAQKRTQAASAEYDSLLAKLTNEFAKGTIGVDQFAERVGRIQGKFKGIGEAERAGGALKALADGGMMAGASSEQLAAAQQKLEASVRAATPPLERLSIDLAKNRADFLAGKVSVEQYRNVIATLPGEINGVETKQQRMDRIFKETQETLRKIRTPLQDYEIEMKKLREQLDAGTIDEQQFAAAAKKTKDVLDGSQGSVKSIGDAFGNLPGPIGAAARALDVMQKSLANTAGGFKGGIGAGISNFFNQIKSGIANAGSTGGASLAAIAPQVGLIAAAAYGAVQGLKALTGALVSVGAEVERTQQLAARLGVSFQEYEILKAAAESAGVEVEALAAAQTRGLKAINEARNGAKEQAEAFALLGVSQEQLATSNPSELLQDVAKKLNSIEDPATRAALTMKIFGKSGNDILPALASLDEMRNGIERLGGTMRSVDVERFSKMDDAFDKVAIAGKRLGTTLLTPFTELFARIANGFSAVAGGFSKAFAPIGNLFAEIGGAIGLMVERLGEGIGAALRFAGALLEIGPIGAAASIIGAAVDQMSRAFEAVDSYVQPLLSGLEQVSGFINEYIGRGITAIATIIGNVVASTGEWVSQSQILAPLFQLMQPLFQGLASAANLVVTAFQSIGGWVKYVVEQLEKWAGIKPAEAGAGFDAEGMKKQQEAAAAQAKAAKEQAKAAEDQAKKDADRAKSIKDGILTPQEVMQKKMAEINDLAEKGLLTAEERARAEAKVREEFERQDPAMQELKKKAEDQKRAAEDITKEIDKSTKAGKDLGDAADPIRAKFKSAAEDIKRSLTAGLISPDEAKKQMEAAADAMNDAFKKAGEQKKAIESIDDAIKNSVKAGKELGAAADGIRQQFVAAANDIKNKVSKGLISPEDARDQMAAATDAMNDELRRLGEDINFAEKIRDELKTAGEKVQEELAKIDANQTLTASEKAKAKQNVLSKARESLPGGESDDPVVKFRKAQQELQDAFRNRVIGEQELVERQARIRDDLNSSVSDLRDKQEQNQKSDKRAVSAVNVNSSEGASTFFRLLRGSDDPTKKQLDEMRRQTRILEKVNAALGEQEVVRI